MVSTSKQPAILDYQNIIFDSSSITFNSTNGTYDHTFLPYLVVPLFYLLTFEGSNVTLSSTNITYDCTYITFSASSFFIHIWWFHLYIDSTNITYDHTYVTFGGSLIFLLTFDSSIVTLADISITYDRTLAHWVVPFFYSHLMVSLSHYAIPTPHMTVFSSHSLVP